MRDLDPAPTRTLVQLLGAAVLTGILAFAALALAGCQFPGPVAPEDIDQRSVSIYTQCPFAPNMSGSGTIIGPEHVVTAMHVVARCPGQPIAIVAHDKTIFVGFLEQLNVHHDTALFGVKELLPRLWDPAPTVVPHADIRVGDVLCTMSQEPHVSQKEKPFFRCGDVYKTYRGWVFADLDSIPGNSGSGVYDSAGRLVGIVSAGFDKGPYKGLTVVSRLPDLDVH